ncbi:methyltransferase family protein [Ensifer sp. 2TAB8]|uniref:methyltransferase family protein n=1 Tax=Ensifer sp. 2TAB8 TaxID=3233006 RepID=UPI003F8FC0BD
MLKGRTLLFADIIGRFGICAYFAIAMLRRIVHAAQIVVKDEWQSADVLALTSTAATVLFLGMVCVVAITRLPPIKAATGFEPYLTAMAGTFLLGLIAYLPEPADTGLALQMAGTAMIVVGMVSSAFVLFWLGRAFSIMPEARTLITGGPYSVVRHPLHLTEEIAIIGLIVLNLSVWSVLLGGVQWLLQFRRMINEERVLQTAFPSYGAYALDVPRILPFMNAGKLRSAQ